MMAPVSYLSPLFVLSPFQVMRAGSIPIFVGDGYPLPLDDADGTGLIPWQRISLRVDGRWVDSGVGWGEAMCKEGRHRGGGLVLASFVGV